MLNSRNKIANTSSKGNQEKWFSDNKWYKLDQFGYEALAEEVTSNYLNLSNIKKETPFTFVGYKSIRVKKHNINRVCCVSDNFLNDGDTVITISRLFKLVHKISLAQELKKITSDKKRIAFLAQETASITGLKEFPEYLTLLFEIDSLTLNDDRHLNNIAVIENNGIFSYCPIFDNGAALLSNTIIYPMDINPISLAQTAIARPFNTTFNRQVNATHSLYGNILSIPKPNKEMISNLIGDAIELYPERDRGIIRVRITDVLMTRYKQLYR